MPLPDTGAAAIVLAALEGSINLIDTADFYGQADQGESGEMVGKALAGRRDDVVLASKASIPIGTERDHRGSSRRWLVRELDNSLRRLGVDHLDLYQCTGGSRRPATRRRSRR